MAEKKKAKKMKKGKKVKDLLNMKEIRKILDGINYPIAFRRALVDLTGSVQSALMLSQAIYWQERAKQPDGWWYKSIEDWEHETGLTRRALMTARKKNRKYLLSDLRDIPAHLYWKVNREELKVDLTALQFGYPEPRPEEDPDQAGGNVQTALAENDHQSGGKEQPGLAENVHQSGGNDQTGFDESGQPAGYFRVNINRYTESTSERITEIDTENNAENNSKIKEGEIEIEMEAEAAKIKAEAETEKEKEKNLLLLLNSCVRVLPEEDPERVTEFITQALETYPEERIREAVNQAAIWNKRSLKGVREILDMWMKIGHGNTPGRMPSHPARGQGPAPH